MNEQDAVHTKAGGPAALRWLAPDRRVFALLIATLVAVSGCGGGNKNRRADPDLENGRGRHSDLIPPPPPWRSTADLPPLLADEVVALDTSADALKAGHSQIAFDTLGYFLRARRHPAVVFQYAAAAFALGRLMESIRGLQEASASAGKVSSLSDVANAASVLSRCGFGPTDDPLLGSTPYTPLLICDAPAQPSCESLVPNVLMDPSSADAAISGKTADEVTNQRNAAKNLYQKAKTAFARGDYRTAIGDFSQAAHLFPRAEFLFNIAQAFRAAGDSQRAALLFRRFATAATTAAEHKRAEQLLEEESSKWNQTVEGRFQRQCGLALDALFSRPYRPRCSNPANPVDSDCISP